MWWCVVFQRKKVGSGRAFSLHSQSEIECIIHHSTLQNFLELYRASPGPARDDDELLALFPFLKAEYCSEQAFEALEFLVPILTGLKDVVACCLLWLGLYEGPRSGPGSRRERLRRGQIAEWRREREKEVRREKLDLPGREICPNKSGARAGDSARDEPG